MLKQCQTRWTQLGTAIAECDSEITTRTAALTGVTDAPLPPAPAAQRRVQKNQPAVLPVYEEAHRLLGVDLSAVPGVSGGVILKAGTRKVTNRITTILRLAANALSRATGRMGEYVRRFKGRLGKAEGIVAGAHT